MTSKLAEEINKIQPFACLEQELLLSIARTSDQLLLRVERLFRDYGLTGSQYNILRILREGGALPILEIARRTVKVTPAITGLIDRLESAGLVSRDRCTKDRRVIYVSITDKALGVLAQLDQPVVALEKKMLGHLSPAEQRELIAALERIRTSLDQQAD